MLNRIEKTVVNNPLRALVQRHLEARWLLELGGRMQGGRALEVGCGRGVGIEIILDEFGANWVDAFDVDPQMVELARARVRHRGPRVRLWTGDALAIQAPDAHYDAVFDFAAIHHVADWRAALAEVHRVLKPGGRFYVEEILARLIQNPVARRLFDHPLEGRFNAAEFVAELDRLGFRLVGEREAASLAAWFVAEKRA